MINTNENVGNYFLVSSSSALQSVLRGRVIIITLSLNTVTEKNNLCLSNLCSHTDRHMVAFSQTLRMYIEIAVLGNVLMRLSPPTDMDGGPAENILPPFVFLIIPFTLP